MLNSIIFTELLEFCRVILTSTIRSENIYLLITLLLILHLELLEFCEHLSLKLDKCYPRNSCELVHKRHKIPISQTSIVQMPQPLMPQLTIIFRAFCTQTLCFSCFYIHIECSVASLFRLHNQLLIGIIQLQEDVLHNN